MRWVRIDRMYEEDKLWFITTLFWYLTVFASYFMEYLFPVELPIGGHFYLYRLALPITVILYGLWCINNKHNPLKGISLIEKLLLVLLGSMLLYGVSSFFWAISKEAWFSQMLSMSMDFCFFYLAVQFYKDFCTCKGTVMLACTTMLLCSIGGIMEMFCGCFFDTPYEGESLYQFIGTYLQTPIFSFYNPNGLAVSALWTLLIGLQYLLNCWNQIEHRKRIILFTIAIVAICLCYFLLKATDARLAIISFFFMGIGLLIWLSLRYKKGLLQLFFAFLFIFFIIYMGESFNAMADPVDVKNKGLLLTDESGAIRINLLKNSMKMIQEVNGLGIGVGNSELRMSDFNNTSGITNVHCFVVEIVLEFGIFGLLPLLTLGVCVGWNWCKRVRYAVCQRDLLVLSNTVFQIFTVLTYPFLSTANSSSWGISSMWLFLAYIVQDCSLHDSSENSGSVAYSVRKVENV